MNIGNPSDLDSKPALKKAKANISKAEIAGDRLHAQLQKNFSGVEDLDDFMTTPSAALVEDLANIDGDIIILGVSGKMGPTLARMAKRAAPDKLILGVARFSEAGVRESLEGFGVETQTVDLLDLEQVQALPKMNNMIFMAGMKFGSSGNQPLTWAMNVHAAAMAADTFNRSRIIAFSTGNVYPLANLETGNNGPDESVQPGPIGEYAQSCLGRERMFEHFSKKHGTPGRIFRLNYAIDLRYGVLFDLAQRITKGDPIDISMGHVNIIWQGDANEQALRLLRHCTDPTSPINITGPETLSIRWLANELGNRLNIAPKIVGQEAATALLSDSSQSVKLFGRPAIPLDSMLDWVADWVARDQISFGKPTKYEVRDGKF